MDRHVGHVQVSTILWKGVHRYKVTFDGVEIECFNDTDCPGVGICAVNQSWSTPSTTGQCMCPTKNGLYGNDCSELCSFGWMIVFVTLATMFSALSVSLISLYLLFGRYCRKHMTVITAPIVTLILTFVACVWVVITSALELIRTIGFTKFYTIQYEQNRQIRRIPHQLENAAAATHALAFAFAKCSLIMLPLTWIDLVERSLLCRVTRAKNIVMASMVLIILVLMVELPLTLIASSQHGKEPPPWTKASITIWGIVCIGTISVNWTAGYKMRKVARSRMVQNQPQRADVQSALNRIKRIALTLSLVDGFIFTLMILGYFRNLRTIYGDPNCYIDIYDLGFRVSLFMVVAACACLNCYVLANSKSRLRQADRQE